jgi:hypothetical protein
MIETHLLDPLDLLDTRLLVPDAAGLVAERLQTQGIASLGAHFRAEGRAGRGLLERLPELDAWLEAVCEALYVPKARPEEPPLDADEIFEALEGLFEPSGGLQPMPSRVGGPVVAPDVAAGAVGLAAGLVIGTVLLDGRATGPLDLPSLELGEALDALERLPLDLGVLTRRAPGEVAQGLVAVFERLLQADPRLGLQLRALRNLCVDGPGSYRVAAARRLHLLAGLVGAGVELPPAPLRSRRARRAPLGGRPPEAS